MPPRWTAYLATFVVLFVVYLPLRRVSWQSGIQLHTLMESLATVLALTAGTLALVRFYSRNDNTFLFIGTAFVGAGLLDGYHAVVTSTFFALYSPSSPPSLIPWSGLASRIFLSVLLWLSWIFWRREARLGEAGQIREGRVYLLAGIWTAVCFFFFLKVPLSIGYKPLPVIHRPQEFVPAVFFLLALIGYLRKGYWKRDPLDHWLILSLIVGIMSQTLFMSTSQALYDAMFDAAHLLKMLSYLCVLVGLLASMFQLFLLDESVIGERTRTLQQSVEQIHQSEAKYRSLISNIPDVLWTADAHLRFAYISPNIERISGFPLDEVYWKGAQLYLDCLHPDDRQKVVQEFKLLFTEGRPYDVECRLRRKNGEWIWVHDRAIATYERDGVRYADGVLSDITVRKRSEEALRKSEQRAKLISETIEDVFWMADTGINQMVYVSPAFERIWGRSRESLYKEPKSFLEAIHPEDRSRVLADLERQKSELPFDHEYRVLRPDGSLAWIWDRGFPVRGANNRVELYVGLAQDITERKRAAAELERAKEVAEAASRAKSEFLANMSHEIRTPMNGVLGMTELALATELTSEQREYLEMIKSSADSLLVIINDILDFSKIEAGKLELERGQFNLEGVLGPALKLLGLQAAAKGLDLNLHMQAGAPETVVGDANRLRQVVVNLVGNAVKFTERGEVTVRAACGPGQDGTAWWYFSVQDTGIGIPAEKQRAIFDAFTQADGSVTRRYGGTGLGLTISRLLIEMMGGRLWLDSAPGKGSTFYFTVPLTVAQPEEQSRARPADLMAGLSVLVVDDNDTNRRILEEVLASWSMRPILAADARTALGHLERESQAGQPIPVVIVDRNMPEIDGFTLVEWIRKDPRLAGATILMLTSGGQPGDAARSQSLGVAACLTKPVGQSELLNAVFQALSPHLLETEPPAPEAGRSWRSLNILLAEDNVVNQKVLSRMLEKRGHRVEIAANGREALDKLSRAGFDLALMDVQMPEMDGLETTAAIRKLERQAGSRLPIIALTAHALKTDRERCLEAGMDAYLSKPIRPDDLFRLIEQVCPGRAVVPERTVETR